MATKFNEALVEVLMGFFSSGNAPARKIIVDTMRTTNPEYDSPQLEVTVAGSLEHLVRDGTLQRTGTGSIRFYAPGKKYCR